MVILLMGLLVVGIESCAVTDEMRRSFGIGCEPASLPSATETQTRSRLVHAMADLARWGRVASGPKKTDRSQSKREKRRARRPESQGGRREAGCVARRRGTLSRM